MPTASAVNAFVQLAMENSVRRDRFACAMFADAVALQIEESLSLTMAIAMPELARRPTLP